MLETPGTGSLVDFPVPDADDAYQGQRITLADLGGEVPANEMKASHHLTQFRPFSPVAPSVDLNKRQWKSLIDTENKYRASLVIRMNAYLEALHVGGCSMRVAGRVSGLCRSEVGALRSRVPVFDQLCRDIFDDVTDKLEEAGINRALAGSDSLLSMMLRNRRPETYNRDKSPNVGVGGAEDITSQLRALAEQLPV
jgi:hypothetical protein